MSLFKTLLLLLAATAAIIFALVWWRGHDLVLPAGLTPAPAPATDMLRAHSNPIGAEPSVPAMAGAAHPVPSAAMPLSDDPRRAGPAVAYPRPPGQDAEMDRRYDEALQEIEVDACNRNGSFAVRVKGQRAPHIMRNGQAIDLPNGLSVTLRMLAYGNCKLVMYDGKNAIGEVVGF